jgi:hypothetical protein
VAVQETRTNDAGRYVLTFASEAPGYPHAPFATPYRVVARYAGLQGDPLAIDLNPTTLFAHDIVLRPV